MIDRGREREIREIIQEEISRSLHQKSSVSAPEADVASVASVRATSRLTRVLARLLDRNRLWQAAKDTQRAYVRNQWLNSDRILRAVVDRVVDEIEGDEKIEDEGESPVGDDPRVTLARHEGSCSGSEEWTDERRGLIQAEAAVERVLNDRRGFHVTYLLAEDRQRLLGDLAYAAIGLIDLISAQEAVERVLNSRRGFRVTDLAAEDRRRLLEDIVIAARRASRLSTRSLESRPPAAPTGESAGSSGRVASRREDSSPMRSTLEDENAQLRREVDRLGLLLRSPQTADFFEAVRVEAAHQHERWGPDHDAGKRPEDWISLAAYLLGKAARAHFGGDRGKLLHHVITLAAIAASWHRCMTAESPGLADPDVSETPGGES